MSSLSEADGNTNIRSLKRFLVRAEAGEPTAEQFWSRTKRSEKTGIFQMHTPNTSILAKGSREPASAVVVFAQLQFRHVSFDISQLLIS